MARVVPVDAAFEGFRIIRDRPGLILTWTAIYFLSVLAMVLILLVPNLGTLQAATHGGGERNIEELWARFGPSILIVLAMALVLVTVLPGAVFRSVLRPADRSFAYIKFGADEWRMLGLYLFLVLIFSIASAAYGAVAVFALRLSGPAEWLIGGLATVGGVAFIGWLFVRLALAGPVVVADEKLAIGRAWKLTRGEFWQLVGTLLLSVVFYFGVLLLALIISVIVAKLFGGFSLLGELTQPAGGVRITQTEALAGIALVLLQQAIWTLLIVLWLVIFSAAPARALQQLRGGPVQPGL
ncbi:MAG: hypothetical protein KA105_01335 [Caulobacter sp.]|nr:hypothetical protein [Caulobacter sp.]